MTVHPFPQSRRPEAADGRAKAPDQDAILASRSGAEQPYPDNLSEFNSSNLSKFSASTSGSGGATLDRAKRDNLLHLLAVYERKWWGNPRASARGIILTGFGLLEAVASKDEAIAFAECILASRRDGDDAA